MPTRLLLALLAGLLLVAAACDENGADEEAADDPEEIEDELGDELDDLGQQEQEEVELEEGVAATLDGEEISDEEVDERYESAAEVPEIAEQIEADENIETLLRAEILGQLVQERLITLGAEELGVEVTDEGMDEAEERIVEQSGGEEALESALEEQGVTDEQYDEVVRVEALIGGIRDRLADEVGDEEAAEAEELSEQTGQEVDAVDLALNDWFSDLMADTEVAVDASYGSWDPMSGQVMPPPDAMPEQPPMGDLEDMDDMDLEELEEELEGLAD